MKELVNHFDKVKQVMHSNERNDRNQILSEYLETLERYKKLNPEASAKLDKVYNKVNSILKKNQNQEN